MLHQDNVRAVFALHLLRVDEAQGEHSAEGHEHHEANVGAVRYGAGSRVQVLTQGNQRADDSSLGYTLAFVDSGFIE